MSASRLTRVLAALVLLGVLAACGQKPGVHVGFTGAGAPVGADGQPLAVNSEGALVDASGAPVDTDGDGSPDTAGVPVAGVGGTGTGATGSGTGGTGTTSPTGTTGGTTGGKTGGSTTPGTSSGGQDPQSPGGGGGGGGGGEAPPGDSPPPEDGGGADPGPSPGITATTIKIGVHAPLTGAAPIPQRSFQEGKDQYWKQGGGITINGRTVEVIFRDDKYNPSAASQACQELILREKVFILSGSGGTDQIAECARIANAYGVPYLSAGVTRVRLDQLSNYFAQSMSYTDQMPILMSWIRKNASPTNKRVGIIASNTANFDDAVAGFEKSARALGYTPYVYRPSKAPSNGELAGVAQKMVTDQVTVATPVMQPSGWINLAKNPQLGNVQWAGVGVTMGLNSVAGVVCPEADGAMFFSPFPGYNLAKQLDPKFYGSDDIQWAQWGSNKLLHLIFTRMDGELTRAAFMEALLGHLETGLFPPTNHTATDHFRVESVHALNLDCGRRQFVSSTSDLFRKGF